MRIVFAGTPEFAVPALDALVAAGHDIAAVYTQPDRPAGRGRRLSPSPVKRRALALNVPVEQPESFRFGDVRSRLADHAPDVMVVVAYGLLLPQSVLEIPVHGCLNIHASLLPRWRGAAPIQRAIAAGDTETGISIMRMEKGLDTGPVLLERRVTISADETAASLHDTLAALGATAIVEALIRLASGDAKARPQDASRATYAHKLSRQEAAIDWSRPAAELSRQVRAFNPWPMAFSTLGEDTLRVLTATPLPLAADRCSPGEIAATSVDGIDVATGEGLLRITQLQLSGKRPMNAAEFLNGHPLAPGARLGG